MNTFILITIVGASLIALAFVARYAMQSPDSIDTFGQVAYGEDKKGVSGLKKVALLNKQSEKEARVRSLVKDDERLKRRVKRNSRFDSKLAKKLRQAHWPISPMVFRLIQLVATVVVFIPVAMNYTVFLQGVALALTPLLVRDVLDFRLKRRMEAFDRDYAVLLMQLVSFVKSGMMALPALEEASKALDEQSLVRHEIQVMFERIHLGMSEEQAIGAFAEDVPHPEIELFVQAFILHTRLGGAITPTLERLAQQVRKSRHFRKEAIAAVAMERLSIYVIAVIMSCLMLYLLYNAPQLIMAAFKLPFGVLFFQGGVAAVLVGFYLSKEVTKIKL